MGWGFHVQGINLGWFHPKKLDAVLCSSKAFLFLRKTLAFWGRKTEFRVAQSHQK